MSLAPPEPGGTSVAAEAVAGVAQDKQLAGGSAKDLLGRQVQIRATEDRCKGGLAKEAGDWRGATYGGSWRQTGQNASWVWRGWYGFGMGIPS